MILSIRNKLSEKYNIKADEINLVKTRGGSAAKILFFAFSGRQKLPFLCVKTSSLERHNSLIESEFNNLKSARNSLPNNLKITISEPLDLLYIYGRAVALEEFISGKQTDPYTSFTDLGRIFTWIYQFHKANIIGRKIVSKDFLSDAMSKYNLRNETDNYILKVLEIWGNRSIEMPLIKQHGDFHFANIFFGENTLKIIDWTNYGKIIFPAYDLVFFLRRQKGGIEANKKIIVDYFNFFSIAGNVLEDWIKILGIVENLEKCSRKK